MRASRLLPLVLALTLAALSATWFAQAGSASPIYRVVVHPSSPVVSVDRQFLQDALLKKVSTWPNGAVIRPVDLAPSSRVRRQFSEDVLKRSVEAVRSYWQQRIFSGRDLPPPELDTDEEVVRYVLKHEGAVGYVSTGADIEGLKIVIVH
jgi:ABC-type phosphate transport system substrate-binding protein